MTEFFADTFYWLAGLNPDDAHHTEALQTTVTGRLVTSWAIQLEVMDALSGPRSRALATRFWLESRQDRNLVIVSLDDQLLERAATLYANRPDKDWSFTDCISFVIMQDRGITTALTKDHHFEQAGFQALFK